MTFEIPVKCSDNVEKDGGFAITLLLPSDTAGKDSLLFASSREMTFRTNNRKTASKVKKGDTLKLKLSTLSKRSVKLLVTFKKTKTSKL